MLTECQLNHYWERGHVTVADVFSQQQMLDSLADLQVWADEFCRTLSTEQQAWYLEKPSDSLAADSDSSAPGGGRALRKLDQPVHERSVFRTLAQHPSLVGKVEQLIGPGVQVFFSQVFMKPPEVGGPKPVHQDNFYFGPDDLDGMVTAWIALDEATEANGCLFYGDGSHRRGVVPHEAPAGQPFNLLVPDERLDCDMTPAPVPQGGVSFHHGNTFHQSSSNRSPQWRRAAAFHYLRNDVKIVAPALEYDLSVAVTIT